MNKEYVAAAMYYITYSTWEIFKHILYIPYCVLTEHITPNLYCGSLLYAPMNNKISIQKKSADGTDATH